VLDKIDDKLDDSCFTSIDRLLITILTDSSSINNLTNSDWSLYQSCLDQSNPANYRYEILEDIVNLMDHPRELTLGELGRLKSPGKADPSGTPVLGCKNNPGSGLFEVFSLNTTFNLQSRSFEVFNSNGQIVMSGVTSKENTVFSLDLTGMPGGVYSLVLQINEQIKSRPVVKLVKF
jgi:hypothetical protein